MSNAYYYEKKLNKLARRRKEKLAEADSIVKQYGSDLLFDDVLMRKVKYYKSNKFKINCDLNLIEYIHEIESNGFKVVYDKGSDSYTVTRKDDVQC